MDRQYFDAMQDIEECGLLAIHITRNAGFDEKTDMQTRKHLADISREIRDLRMLLQDIINEQRHIKI